MKGFEQVIESTKTLVRRNPAAYELVRRRRARRLEREYVNRRDSFAQSGQSVFAPPGYLARSKALLPSIGAPEPRGKSSPSDVRIFAALADDPGAPQIVESLRASFDAVIFDLAQYRSPDVVRASPSLEWRGRLQRDLVSAFEDAHSDAPFDLVFTYASHLELEAETLQRIRSAGVPVAVLCLDDKHKFAEAPVGHPNGQEPLIGAADVHLTNSLECVRWYMARGAPAYYMPQGVHPDLFRSSRPAPDIGVSFVGQRYGFRQRFIEALLASGIEVSCYGPGWGRVVSDAEMVDIYRGSRINLGIGGVAYSENLTCLKGRDFEIPASGGLYLTTYDPELARLFDIGREILCYRNAIDCVEQIRYYLENTDEADAIAKAGRERCLRSHTWEARVSSFARWLGVLDRDE